MAIGVADFLRILHAIPQCRDRHTEDGLVRVAFAGGAVTVRYAALPDRELGLLRLPVTRIEMSFDDVPEDDAGAFVRSFELHFRRAGG